MAKDHNPTNFWHPSLTTIIIIKHQCHHHCHQDHHHHPDGEGNSGDRPTKSDFSGSFNGGMGSESEICNLARY